LRLRVTPNPEAFRRLRSSLEGLELSNADKAGPLLREMDLVHVRQVKTAFSGEGATVPTGPWPRLSPRYAAWKKRQVGRKKMLRLTDDLYQKATMPGHPDHVRMFTPPFRLGFGYRDEAGFYNQEGGIHLPKRSVVDKDAVDLWELRETLRAFYMKRMRQVTRGLGRLRA